MHACLQRLCVIIIDGLTCRLREKSLGSSVTKSRYWSYTRVMSVWLFVAIVARARRSISVRSSLETKFRWKAEYSRLVQSGHASK